MKKTLILLVLLSVGCAKPEEHKVLTPENRPAALTPVVQRVEVQKLQQVEVKFLARYRYKPTYKGETIGDGNAITAIPASATITILPSGQELVSLNVNPIEHLYALDALKGIAYQRDNKYYDTSKHSEIVDAKPIEEWTAVLAPDEDQSKIFLDLVKKIKKEPHQ